MAFNPLVIKNAGLPGAADSYYSAEKTLSVIGTTGTLVPEIGWILFEAGQNAALSVKLKIAATPTYATLSAAGAGACVWSDGTNVWLGNSSTTMNAKYFVVAHKP